MFRFIVHKLYNPVLALIRAILNLLFNKKSKKTITDPHYKLCPEARASFASRVTFSWLDPLVWKGYRHPLTIKDLWELRYQDEASQITPQFQKFWDQQKGRANIKDNGISGKNGTLKHSIARNTKEVNVLWPIFRMFWKLFVAGGTCRLLGDIFSLAGPQILRLMIKFVASDEPSWRGVVYAIGLFIASEIQTLFIHHNLKIMSVLGLNIKTTLVSAIYKKSLRISGAARRECSVGEVVNLIAVDAQRFIDFSIHFNFLYAAPFTVATAMYFLWDLLGPSAFAGLAVMVILVSVNITVANLLKSLQMKQMKYKDERVKLMNEVLSGVKVLKLYAWEPSFEQQIRKIRECEVNMLKNSALLNTSVSFLWACSPFLVSLATLGVFVLSDERNILTAEVAFVAASLFNLIKIPLNMFPKAVQILVQTLVSTKRINRFLNAEELDPYSVSHNLNEEEPLVMDRATLSWGAATSDQPILRDITLRVRRGSLVAVVGAVGSGKSSLISAFLGEMDKISGYINTSGRIAYVPQQAWIQNATVKDNIVFGSTLDPTRYQRTVMACALVPDFEMLPGGDGTEIGEKGINLSGGQKQRVSLARAVYNDADTYLLDDPLSAVDSHVGKLIFDNVIGPRGVLSKKTRLLVTHGVTFLPEVDIIVVLKDGKVSETGTFKELLAKRGDFSEFLAQHLSCAEESEIESRIEKLAQGNHSLKDKFEKQRRKEAVLSDTSRQIRIDSIGSKGRRPNINRHMPFNQLIQSENAETGSVKIRVYGRYIRSFGSHLASGFLISLMFFQVFSLGANVWLSVWTSDETAVVNGVHDVSKRDYYLKIYLAFGLGQFLATLASALCLALGSVQASEQLHASMLARVMRAPMSFFDTTPLGRLINRFSKDIDVVDNTLPDNINATVRCFALISGTLIVISWSTPICIFAIIPLGLLYILIQSYYIATSRQLKRIESVTQSPIYSHFSETVCGVSSVRAYSVEERFIRTLEARVDQNHKCLYPSMVCSRWLGVRLETVGNLIIFFAALFAMFSRGTLNAGVVGFSIGYALQITHLLNYAVFQASEVETNIVSVERISEYTNIPQEAALQLEYKQCSDWPQNGSIHFQNYQVRYRKGLDLALRGITFNVKGGEKIGIVGRTGAGKSSLTLCLFRILEADGGHISIDGVDIAKVGLGDLRSKLTIIPQDPVLFSGSLRMNLDPFERHSDSDVWSALQLAHLSDSARGLAAGLHHTITEGGDNISVGQRQLICLARALLRKTKVLILDEATAAIDLETDDLIQQTIRREFKDCTVLTIAHRLNTIMDSDRVLVLDKGTIKEFDSPSNLLRSETSTFYGMAKDAGLINV